MLWCTLHMYQNKTQKYTHAYIFRQLCEQINTHTYNISFINEQRKMQIHSQIVYNNVNGM